MLESERVVPWSAEIQDQRFEKCRNFDEVDSELSYPVSPPYRFAKAISHVLREDRIVVERTDE